MRSDSAKVQAALCVVTVIIGVLLVSCTDASSRSGSARDPEEAGSSPVGIDDPEDTPSNAFDAFMSAPIPPADGFDYPVGNAEGKGSYVDPVSGKRFEGWYVATKFGERYSLGIHPGEDWNGSGGGNTDLGQDVRAVANGRVILAEACGRNWGNVVVIEHLFYENNRRKTIRSLYAHLNTIHVKKGAIVTRRERIGAIGRDPDKTFDAHLHLEFRWNFSLPPTYWPSSDNKSPAWVREHYADPRAFIAAHRSLPVPQREKTLVLVDHDSYTMRLYRKAKLVKEIDVSFGQSRGRKRLQGDNKTPQGMYFVIDKRRGTFEGEYGGYFGGHWTKINYPNRYDAAWGRLNGHITAEQEKEISRRWSARKGTLEGTKLGGGIGFHGWISEWEDDGPRHLSWGCIVLHLSDVGRLYDMMPAGTMVVIF